MRHVTASLMFSRYFGASMRAHLVVRALLELDAPLVPVEPLELGVFLFLFLLTTLMQERYNQ